MKAADNINKNNNDNNHNQLTSAVPLEYVCKSLLVSQIWRLHVRGVHQRMSLMRTSLLHRLCPLCIVCFIWMFFYINNNNNNNNNNNKIIKGHGSWRTSGDHPNYYVIENGQNTEKSPGDLRTLTFTQTPVKDHQLTLI